MVALPARSAATGRKERQALLADSSTWPWPRRTTADAGLPGRPETTTASPAGPPTEDQPFAQVECGSWSLTRAASIRLLAVGPVPAQCRAQKLFEHGDLGCGSMDLGWRRLPLWITAPHRDFADAVAKLARAGGQIEQQFVVLENVAEWRHPWIQQIAARVGA